MDVLEQVREVNAGASLAPEQISGARSRLLEGIDAGMSAARPRIRRRPMFLIVGSVGGAVAAVTVGALIIGALTAPEQEPAVEAIPTREPGPSFVPSPMPETAAQVLQGAAIASESYVQPVPGPGEYLRRETTTEGLWLFREGSGASEPEMGVSRSMATSAWILTHSVVSYMPADLAGENYTVFAPAQIGELFGDVAQADIQSRSMVQHYGLDQESSSWQSLRSPLDVEGVNDLQGFVAAMPRDPAAMVVWIRDHLGEDREGWVDGKVGWVLIGLLSMNAGPPELRAAMYLALSELPGSTVGAPEGGTQTVTFDSTLAWSGDDTALMRYTLTVDMNTGLVVETTHTSEVGQGLIPSDVPDTRTVYSIAVVSALP